jgi:hypothetical protein
MAELDELFGGGRGQVQPRTALILGLLGSGIVLGVLGLACSSLPGGALVLLAWNVAEREMERIESGYLPLDYGPRVTSLRRITWLALLVVIGLFFVQGGLLCTGFYESLWGGFLERLSA